MPKKVRLNRMIELFEQGKIPIGVVFENGSIGDAIRVRKTDYDFCIWDMEHGDGGFDFTSLNMCHQFMLDRKQLVEQGNLQAKIVPMTRVPAYPFELEYNMWQYKIALDAGVYGLLIPALETVEEMLTVVRACRYASAPGEPKGCRGAHNGDAVRYWGMESFAEYSQRADIWPLNPEGEILFLCQIETATGVKNLRSILQECRNMIGGLELGRLDLSVSLGHPGEREHPEVQGAVREVMEIAKEFGVPVGGRVFAHDVAQKIEAGYQFMYTLNIDLETLALARRLTGRA